jgi:hypothetical protein
MADHGWLTAAMGESPTPLPRSFDDAFLQCRERGPAIAVAVCLRTQGLEVADPAVGRTSSVQPYPSAASVPAWQACRDVYVRSLGTPLPSEALTFLDCMAEHGWLTVVFTELPADPSLDEARSACRR